MKTKLEERVRKTTGRRRGAHSDFADGVTEAFVRTELVECHGVELALVEVRHRTLALLLA